jgi:carbon storage regulator
VLVFTRRRGEAIIIGDGIEVQVLRVGREGVRLGVVAPTSVPVHRHEIYAQICEANRTAANPLPDLAALSRRLQRRS